MLMLGAWASSSFTDRLRVGGRWKVWIIVVLYTVSVMSFLISGTDSCLKLMEQAMYRMHVSIVVDDGS